MKQANLTQFMSSLIVQMEEEGRWSTARIYSAALHAVTSFVGGGEVFFGALSIPWLNRLENYLRSRQLQWNTVSTYLRMLRATYNRAVVLKLTYHIPGLFDKVYTGVKRERKLALSAQMMHSLLYAPPRQPLPPAVAESREQLRIMFEFQGIPFVDLIHLHRSDLDTRKRLLTCHRQKTGTSLTIDLTPSMMKWIEEHSTSPESASPYLLNILSGTATGIEDYEEHQHSLRQFNRNLQKLARIQGIKVRITSYTARHTWATLAKYCNIPEGLICDALGHTSVKTTETYLKSFDNDSLKRANSKVIGTVKRAVTL